MFGDDPPGQAVECLYVSLRDAVCRSPKAMSDAPRLQEESGSPRKPTGVSTLRADRAEEDGAIRNLAVQTLQLFLKRKNETMKHLLLTLIWTAVFALCGHEALADLFGDSIGGMGVNPIPIENDQIRIAEE